MTTYMIMTMMMTMMMTTTTTTTNATKTALSRCLILLSKCSKLSLSNFAWAEPQIKLYTPMAGFRQKKGRGKEGDMEENRKRGWEMEEERSCRTLPLVLQHVVRPAT